MHKVNIGSGKSALSGWVNIDNSLSVLISKSRLATKIATISGMLNSSQLEYVSYAKTNRIIWANAAKKIPLPDNSAKIVYSSHMIEHLDPIEATSFLIEVRRVLAPLGILRLAFPDIKKCAAAYIENGDADAFIKNIHMATSQSRSFTERLKRAVAGERNHLWMYDGPSMVRKLAEVGFSDPQIVCGGKTRMPPGHGVDLFERGEESAYVEAIGKDKTLSNPFY